MVEPIRISLSSLILRVDIQKNFNTRTNIERFSLNANERILKWQSFLDRLCVSALWTKRNKRRTLCPQCVDFYFSRTSLSNLLIEQIFIVLKRKMFKGW